jgi:hypothetical protein
MTFLENNAHWILLFFGVLWLLTVLYCPYLQGRWGL